MRRLVAWAAAAGLAAARTTPGEDAYVRAWAGGGSSRCGAANCSWMKDFGPIDVGCRVEVARVGLGDGKGPAATFAFADGSTLAVDAATASDVDRFATRPALCEYVPRGVTKTPGVALVMVANSPAYLFRLWPPFLNKLLYAADAGLRPFVWIGELPEKLERPTSRACHDSVQVRTHAHPADRRNLRSFYDARAGAGDAPPDVSRVSNHYVKMPAALATLAAPGVEGLYYVDLDAVTAWPWTVDSNLLQEHRAGFSDVSFKYGFVEGADNARTLRWKVHGSRFYVRDVAAGRRFFASWFANRCTFKDQYSLWHTILEYAASAGCVDYAGEIFRLFRYKDAKHVKSAAAFEKYPALALDCARVDAACPRWRFANVGGAACALEPPNVADQIYHHTIPPGGSGTFHVSASGRDLVVENACFSTEGTSRENLTRCDYTDGLEAYLRKLGVPDRDRGRHPWGD